MLSVSNLSRSYGGRRILNTISFVINPGERIGLIGPNGAGKSSLLRAIVGLVPAGGDVQVDGSPLALRSRRRRAALIAYVPQLPLLPEDMTGFEYVLLGRSPYVGYFGTESRHDKAMARDVLRRLDLTEFADRRLGELSGGERQRLVIARALAQEAPILLLDEPTSALDIGHQQQALELVEQLRLQVGLTVLSTMHDLTVAGQYSQEFVLLDRGRAVARGSAEEVLRADLIERFYRASVDVLFTEAGLVVVPTRPPPKGGTG
jgi:iron complex transport system ATP-binding protein